jgi:hypothetical protein
LRLTQLTKNVDRAILVHSYRRHCGEHRFGFVAPHLGQISMILVDCLSDASCCRSAAIILGGRTSAKRVHDSELNHHTDRKHGTWGSSQRSIAWTS